MSKRGVVLFAAMSVIWGIPYLLIRVAVEELSPEVVVFGRSFIGAVVLVPFALRSGTVRKVLTRWRPVLVYTAIEVAAPWYLLSDAEQHITSSLAGLLIASVPLMGAALAILLHVDDRLDATRTTGLLIGFAGVIALVGLDLGDGLEPWPVAEVLLVALGYAIGPIIIARSMSDLNAVAVNAVVLTITAVGYTPFAIASWPEERPSTEAIGSVVGLGLICTALAFVLFFALIREVGPARATVITYVNPAVALAAGVILLDEPVTVGIIVGFPLVLLGSVLATRRTRKPTAGPPGEEGYNSTAATTPA